MAFRGRLRKGVNRELNPQIEEAREAGDHKEKRDLKKEKRYRKRQTRRLVSIRRKMGERGVLQEMARQQGKETGET